MHIGGDKECNKENEDPIEMNNWLHRGEAYQPRVKNTDVKASQISEVIDANEHRRARDRGWYASLSVEKRRLHNTTSSRKAAKRESIK